MCIRDRLEEEPEDFTVTGPNMLTALPQSVTLNYNEIAYALEKSLIKPVSYTHLDVYKRQVGGSPTRPLSCAFIGYCDNHGTITYSGAFPNN